MNNFKITFIEYISNKITIAKDEIRLKINNKDENYISKVIEIANMICDKIKYEDRTLRCKFNIDNNVFKLYQRRKLFKTIIL